MYVFILRLSSILVILNSITGCDREHAGEQISEFSGDYRYISGIGEFFDCASAQKYYVFNSSGHPELISEYQKLALTQEDDAYIKVKGYLKEMPQLEGIDPEIEFVPVELISIDPTRGCQRGKREGN